MSTFALAPSRCRGFHSVSTDDDDDEASTERNVAAVSPIPKIVTTPIKEDFTKEDEDCTDEWGKSLEQVLITVPRNEVT